VGCQHRRPPLQNTENAGQARQGEKEREEAVVADRQLLHSAVLGRPKGKSNTLLQAVFFLALTHLMQQQERLTSLRSMQKILLFHCSAWWLLSMCSLRFYSHNFTFIYLGPLSSNPCTDLISSEVLDVEEICDGIQLLLLPMQVSALLFAWWSPPFSFCDDS